MKKIYKASILLLLLLLLFVVSSMPVSYGFSVIRYPANGLNASSSLSLKNITAREFVKLSPREFSALTGKKLNFFQRLSFKIVKLRLKHDLKKNPNLTINQYMNNGKTDCSFSICWFLLGLVGPLLGLLTGSLIGVVLVAAIPIVVAYLTMQEKYKINSAWIGLGAGVIIFLVLAVIALSQAYF
jgi:hypothetical protein